MNFNRLLLILTLLLAAFKTHACEELLESKFSAPLDRQLASSQLAKIILKQQSLAAAQKPPLQETLDSIYCYLENQSELHPQLSGVKSQLKKITDGIGSGDEEPKRKQAIVELSSQINRDAGTGYVEFPSESDLPYTVGLYDEIIDANCGESPTLKCASSLNYAAHLWWIATYMRTIPDYFNDQNIVDSLSFNERLNDKWRSYKDDTILLWPQEVLLNSIVFNQEARGFTEPPAYKLMALRPSLGLSYLSDESHRIQPTLNVDLFGVYWWKYGGERGAKARGGKGLAMSAIWDGSDVAYGLSYHHNPKWSATIASGSDNDVVISISFQLAAWLLR